ncbi:hypothetical protein ACFWAY_16035 [Rhodococcus sp. NPDC059968]|uniref:hypothetical protein n=1 Tax=Rhodococcus sp. NPDC059968 TaxID=3347017 RepID=UPI00366C5452
MNVTVFGATGQLVVQDLQSARRWSLRTEEYAVDFLAGLTVRIGGGGDGTGRYSVQPGFRLADLRLWVEE